MSKENVELVLSLYRTGEERDFITGLEGFSRHVVWDMRGFGMPDLARVYRGIGELTEFWIDWLDAWESIEFTSLDAEDHGDHVIVAVKQHNRGRESGVDVEFEYFQTWTIRDGKVTASTMAETRADALRAIA